MQLEQLPGYALDLNPEEGIWKHLKCVELKNLCCESLKELKIELRKAAMTELFAEARNGSTPVMVERIVTDIDGIVRVVRFPGWQGTKAG